MPSSHKVNIGLIFSFGGIALLSGVNAGCAQSPARPVKTAGLPRAADPSSSPLARPATHDLQGFREAPYNVAAPLYPRRDDDAQKADQSRRGAALLQDIQDKIKAGAASYTVPSGVYRLSSGIGLGDSQGFQLNAADCTFILVSTGSAFVSGGDCTNIAIVGPLTVDHEPYAVSQGVITAANPATGAVTCRIMPDYSVDVVSGGGLTLYNPDGTAVPLPSYSKFSNGKMTDPAGRLFSFTAPQGTAALFVPGALVSLPINGGGPPFAFTFKSLHNVRLQDIQLGSGGPLLAGGQSGDSRFLRIQNGRKPGTNRLASGQSMQSWNSGGTVVFDGCEFGTSEDDVMDFQGSGLHMFYRTQPGRPNQIVVWNWFGGVGFSKGDRITLYDPKNFVTVAQATVVSAAPLADDAVMKDANRLADGDNTFHLQRSGQTLTLVTLAAPLTATPGDLLENLSGRVKSFTMNGCYFHDSRVRVMVEGFSQGTFTNNTFERVNGGLSLATDVWWPQGGGMENILVKGNVFKDSPYNAAWGSESGSVNIGPLWNVSPPKAGQGYANKNILITGNAFFGSAKAAVTVADASNVTVSDNVIENVGAVGKAAIELNVVGQGRVYGNKISHSQGPVLYVGGSQGIKAGQNFVDGQPAPASAVKTDNSTSVVAESRPGHS